MNLDALFDAATAGDVDAIAKLEMQADKLDEKEYTILHTEARKGNAERVRFILREFAHKNLLTKITKYFKQTALHLAALHGHTEVAEVLIEAARDLPPSFHAFLRQADDDMNTALHAAVMEENVAIVKLLVEADPTDRHIQNHNGKTPMYIAVEKGYNDIIEIISTTCTAPSLDGPYGDTVVRIDNLDQVKSPGGTLYKIKDRYAFYDAAINDGDAEARAKLEMEADKLDFFGETILHVESRLGKTECVRFLLKEFANKNLLVKLSRDKQTALHLAMYNEHAEVAEVLIDAARHLPNDDTHHDNPVTSFQAFLRQADKYMNTALHLAVRKGHVDIVKLLVEADSTDRHIQNHEGKTPMYIAAERGYFDVVKIMCTTCRVPINLDGPGSTTALHSVIKNLDKDKKEKRDLIRLIINAVKIVNIPEDAERYLSAQIKRERDERLVQLFKKTDEDRCTILELAVERNYEDVVELILAENPAYQRNYFRGRLDHDMVGLLPLIYKAGDKEYRDVLQLLNQRFGMLSSYSFSMGNMAPLLSAIRRHNYGKVLWWLDKHDTKILVSFIDDVGWTALHHAAYHEFNEVIKPIVEAQKKFGHEFVYPDKRPTPFHLAAQKGFTSTVILLLQLWPSSSSAYIAIDKDGQNILHLAALQSKKEMIQAILKYCPEEHKKDFVNKQDINGNTPLHLLIRRGCLVPELLRYQGLDTTVKNHNRWTPPDMLYVEVEIIDDQVKIKIALDHIQIDQKIFSSSVLSISKREEKDAMMKKQANQMIHQMHARMKEDTRAVAKCFADAIAGDLISKAALEMEADTLQEEGKTTILHETIRHVESMRGVAERVEYILREFAIKNLLVKLDISKQTALHVAAHHGHTQVVEALIEAARHLPSSSANDDTHNPIRSFQDFIRRPDGQMGNTALHLAVLNGNMAIVKLLVQADPNDNHVQNKECKTPIYIAVEKGYKDIVEDICTTCTALSVNGPGGRTTTLHALIQNAGQGASDMIRMIVQAAKRWSTSSADYEALFCRTDELGSTVLQLAVERDYVSVVELILQEDPAYQQGREIKRNGLMRLIYKAIDKNCSDDIIKLLSQTYEAGIDPDHEHVLALILAMKRRDEDSVLRLLGDAKVLVNFTEDNGWTPLHYAAYHEFDSILGAIIEAQEDVGHQFVYGDLVSTPFHVAIEHGYTSTLVRLMQLWPTLSSASIADKSPYTVVNKDGQNILHLAAAGNKKEMVQGILKYCPGMYKDKVLKQQDINGDTPLHVLISQGCFIPELIKDEGIDTMAKNKYSLTPWEMLYFKNDVVADQVEIKIAIDDVQTNQSAWKKKTDIWKSIPPSKRRIKDLMFDEQKIKLMDAKHEQRKKDLERYKMRTNTQIIVTALITTVTFTVGFTMPGGLRQSGEVDEGLALLSKKAAFNAFMILDALALLLSTSSLFFYFLESMNEDPRQVRKLNAASTVLNIVSVMAMMSTFIAGTYLVLSHTPALAITVCIICSLFFLHIIFLVIKKVYDRLHVKRN